MNHVGLRESGQGKETHQLSVDSPIATQNLAGRTGDVGEAREEEVNNGHLLGQRPRDERRADIAEKRHGEKL
jgi:hypothetical protein